MALHGEQGFLGLDIGGTGVKAGVFDDRGRCRGFARRACAPAISAEGHVEIPVEAIESAARAAVREAVAASGMHVRAMAIGSQGQTFVPLDAADRALYPAILWYDGRSADQAERLKHLAPEIEPIAAGAKILWLREHHPRVAEAARRYLLLPDLFAYRLTGVAATDPETAASTGLCWPDHRGYRPQALDATGIGLDQLAPILPAGAVIGPVLAHVAEDWGLAADTTLVVGTNDQYAGAIGAGNCREGIISETSGTCLAIITLVRELPRNAALITGPFPIAPLSFVLAYAKTAGVLLEWIARELAGVRSLAGLEQSAAQVPPGSRGLRMLPHFDGKVSPAADPSARGVIQGLSLQHSVSDIYRAALESLAFVLRENVECWSSAGLTPEILRCIGGGARSDLWIQIKADVLGREIERPSTTEAATLGAAMLAAFGTGAFTSLQDASQQLYRRERVFEPFAHAHDHYEICYEQWKAVGIAGSGA